MVKENTLADVAVWGRIPPPIGGMAVHLRRLLPHLTEAGITVQMYSVGRLTQEHSQVRQVSDHRIAWYFQLLFGPSEPIHYVFSDDTLARFAASLLVLFRGTKVILRIGGESLTVAFRSKIYLERFMIRFAIRHASVIVGVNEDICTLALSLGAKRVLHVPGFIPEVSHGDLPLEVSDFIGKCHCPVLLSSGEIHDPDVDDLYGAYLLLDLLECISDVCVVFFAYTITLGIGPQVHLAAEILKRGLENRYLLFRSEADLMPAMLCCDIMVRPTTSDGDSNSIREALHIGLPVIASDCVNRPEGVVTFPSGNLEEMKKVVEMVLNNREYYRNKVRILPKQDNAKPIVALFRELLEKSL
ncbi:MAG: glycosyltransferase [Chlorobium sp.]